MTVEQSDRDYISGMQSDITEKSAGEQLKKLIEVLMKIEATNVIIEKYFEIKDIEFRFSMRERTTCDILEICKIRCKYILPSEFRLVRGLRLFKGNSLGFQICSTIKPEFDSLVFQVDIFNKEEKELSVWPEDIERMLYHDYIKYLKDKGFTYERKNFSNSLKFKKSQKYYKAFTYINISDDCAIINGFDGVYIDIISPIFDKDIIRFMFK